jgi:fatty-acyl-CoA synthase
VNGRNVWPQDLEWSVEQAVASVRTGDAAAFTVEEDEMERVVMLIEARGLSDSDARTKLLADAAGTLRARHGLEARIVLVPPGSLPHTSSGKLSRMAARARYLAGVFTAPAPSWNRLPNDGSAAGRGHRRDRLPRGAMCSTPWRAQAGGCAS